jgi:hypothetical protein
VTRLVEVAKHAPPPTPGNTSSGMIPLDPLGSSTTGGGTGPDDDELDIPPPKSQASIQQAPHVGPKTVVVEMAVVLLVFAGIGSWAVVSAQGK